MPLTEKDIEKHILDHGPQYTVTMDHDAIHVDISTYVTYRLDSDEKFRCLTTNMKTEIQEKLLAKSRGMYLPFKLKF